MTEGTTLGQLAEQGDTASSGEPRKTLCGRLNRGILATAWRAGRAGRACREGLSATGALLTTPFRRRELPLSFRASKAIHHAQVRLARWRKDIQELTDRLAERLASNVVAGRANPADEPDARDCARAIETAKARVLEVESLVETLAGTVALLEERLTGAGEEEELAPAAKEGPAATAAKPVPAASREAEPPQQPASGALSESAPEAESSSARRPGGARFTTQRQQSRPKPPEPKVPPTGEASAAGAEDETGSAG